MAKLTAVDFNPFKDTGAAVKVTPVDFNPFKTNEVVEYSESEAPVSFTPMGGGGFGVALANYLGYGPDPEVREATLPDGTTGQLTRSDEIGLGFDLGTADYQRWSSMLQAVNPTGSWVDDEGTRTDSAAEAVSKGGRLLSAEEYYGDEFMAADFDNRMLMMNARREATIKEAQAGVVALQEAAGGEDATSMIVGDLLAEVATPTLLAPIGKSIPAMMGIGGLVTGQMELSAQLAMEKEKDLGSVGKSTLFGALAGPLFGAPVRTTVAIATAPVKAARYLSNKVTKVMAKEGSTKSANKIVGKMERKFDEKIAEGKTRKQTLSETYQELGLKPEEVVDVLAKATWKPTMPQKKTAITRLSMRNNPLESTTKLGKAYDYLASPITATIKKISQPVFGALRKYEFNASVSVARSKDKTKGYLTETQRILKKGTDEERAAYSEVDNALQSGEFLRAAKLAQEKLPFLAKQLISQDGKTPVIKEILDDLYTRAKTAGIKVGYIENYFPRAVKDLEGLKEAMGSTLRKPVEAALNKIAKKQGVEVQALDEEVIADVINKMYQKSRSGVGGPSKVEAGRVIDRIPPELQEFYHDGATSLSMYTDRMEQEIAKRNFFNTNKSLAEKTDGTIDVDGSVGNLVAQLVKNNQINYDQADHLRLLLGVRFNEGEQAMGGLAAVIRDGQTAVLLAQFQSAAIQLSDIGQSMYVNGLGNTLKALATRNSKALVTVDDLGLLNKVAAEFNNSGGMSKATNKFMKYALFTDIDKLGKNVLIQSALTKATKQAIKDPKKLVDKYKQVFGDEMDNLLGDLRRGEMTENVKLMLWNDLSDIQPISLSEMPAGYLKVPNGRIFYSFKSFALKQLNVMRNDIVDEARKGNTKQALENAARYALFVGGMGATVEETRKLIKGGFDKEAMDVDMSSGENFVETFPDAVAEYMLKILFLNEYSREKYLAVGDVGSFLANTVAPPGISVMNKVGKTAVELTNDEIDWDVVKKNMSGVTPVVGAAWYNFMGGGAEDFIAKQEAKRLKELKDRDLRRAM